MATIKRFEDLDCWLDAREFVRLIYKLTKKIMFKKDFELLIKVISMKTLIIKSLLPSLCQREGIYPSLAKRGEGRFFNNDALLITTANLSIKTVKQWLLAVIPGLTRNPEVIENPGFPIKEFGNDEEIRCSIMNSFVIGQLNQ